MPNNKRANRFWIIPGMVMLIFHFAEAQSLEQKLSQTADFAPTANNVEARLIEVAQHYKIAMGIELVFDNTELVSVSPLAQGGTVRELLNSILRDAPNYEAQITDGVFNIHKKPWFGDRRNFLNLPLNEIRIERASTIHAEASLRHQIHATLHPERYTTAFNGGYGGPAGPESFQLKSISITGRHLTVRQVLDSIIKQNGNAFWVVELVPSRTIKNEPYFAPGSSAIDAKTDFFWRILPFD